MVLQLIITDAGDAFVALKTGNGEVRIRVESLHVLDNMLQSIIKDWTGLD